ncbi:CBS domain-containing protein [Bremerella sp. T1]|uniref:CBS domain-containing protein n=1 Tax=Bremerella sp. TYQ1 TaxID=3119568 RepID=UPI001CC9E8F7|nr:CBS domain-containing protein [Bremerella volcania]UBM37455.1 CBS domain-containing protein [Bremerella volcania]
MILNQSFLRQGIDSLVTFNPICIHANTPLYELLERLYCTGFHHWPVVDDHRNVVGIVSDIDIVRGAIKYRDTRRSLPTVRDEYCLPTSQVMQTTVKTLASGGSSLEGLDIMLANEFHSLPVTQSGALWGMVTTTDYIREFAYSTHAARSASIESLTDASPHFVDICASIEDVQQTMEANNLCYVIASQEDCPLGVITAKDLRQFRCRLMARSLFEGKPAETAKAIDLIKTTSRLSPDATLGETASMMFEQQISAVMVLPKGDSFCGVITQEQVLKHLHQLESSVAV